MKIVAIVLLAGALAGGAWRTFVHSSDLKPALVTPSMDVHAEFSNDLSARIYRLTHDRVVALADRSDRPKLIALTFDDGPYPIFTPLLLDELHDLRVPATFFLIGRDAQQWPGVTRAVLADGDEIADHTLTHPDLDHESAAQVRSEIVLGRDMLWSIAPDASERTLMRPPHGRYTLATMRVAQRLGYHVVLWTDDSGDWRTLTPAQIERHLTLHATAPEIVLLHDGKLGTIEALPLVVDRFRAAGYRFVTVSELLRAVPASDINHPARHAL